MTFSNSVVGGITLVRPAIRSPNYVLGSTGWTINADGSAEFNNVTVRGSLIIGTSPFPLYEIVGGSAIPAELQTQYSSTVITAELCYFSATDYTYRVFLSDGSVIAGRRVAGPTFIEGYRIIPSGLPVFRAPGGVGFSNAVTPTAQIIERVAGALDIEATTIRFQAVGGGSAVPEFLLNGVSQGRGTAGNSILTSSSANVTAETVVNSFTMTFQDSRAYSIRFGGRIDTSDANGRPRCRLRKTNVAGTQWGDFGGWTTNVNVGEDLGVASETILRRATGAGDLTATVCLTLEHLAGGANTARLVASATNPFWFGAEDIGTESLYPGAVSVT